MKDWFWYKVYSFFHALEGWAYRTDHRRVGRWFYMARVSSWRVRYPRR